MPVYFARPEGAAKPPAILVAMEVFGLHEYIKDVVRRLAKLGAFAVAPGYYFRKGVDLTKITDFKELMPIVNAKPDAELIADLDATAAWAKAQGADVSRLGIIGFCRGGRAVWIYAAHSEALKAGVAFYGSLVDPVNPGWPKSPLQLAPGIKAPVLGLYGDADQGIPVSQVEQMEAALKAAGKTAEFHMYAGAPHGFHADYRPSYRKEAAQDAWRRAEAWFKTYKVLIVMTARAALLAGRAVLEVAGGDRANFLQGLVTNDIAALKDGEAAFAGLLTPQGKILFDFFVIASGESFLLDCPAPLAADLLKRLSLYKLRAKVAVSDVSARFLVAAAWGDSAAEWAKANASVDYPDPRLPALGLRMLLDAGAAPAFSAQFEDYEAMRVGLAVPDGGKDYAYGDAFPHEACFDLLNGVSFRKGCFVGQEVVSRMQHRGTARSRILAVTAGEPLSQPGADILADGLSVGRLGSVAGNSGVAMARLDRVGQALAKGAAFTADGVEVELSVPAWANYSLNPAPAEAAP